MSITLETSSELRASSPCPMWTFALRQPIIILLNLGYMTTTQNFQIDAPKMRPAKYIIALLFFLAIRPLGAQDVEPYISPGAQIGWSGEGLFMSFQVSAGVLTYVVPILIAPAVTLGYRLYRGGKVLFLDGQATVLLGRGSTSPFALGMGTGRAWLNSD